MAGSTPKEETMLLRQIPDLKLAQYTYLIGCQRSGEALLIDPERDIDRYIEIAASESLRITAVAETHIHADFLSGSRELAERLGVKLYLSDEGPAEWKYEWAIRGDYDLQLLHDGDIFSIGQIEIQALHTPGHTPEHLSFLVTDRGGGASEPIAIATGDFVFVGDLGRPDLLESAAGIAGQMDPSARALFRSVDRFLDLADFIQVWPAHGAGSACGKALGAVPSSTVGYERRMNASIDTARHGEDSFVQAILSGQPEPPLYFADMKRLNKVGPPVLGSLPRPRRLSAKELAAALDQEGTAVLDTASSREQFFTGHLEGSLYTPLSRSFPTTVGSLVRLEETIVLISEEDRVEEAVRDLVRIGFDQIAGWAPPEVRETPELLRRIHLTKTIDFAQMEATRKDPGVQVLDVRGAAEVARSQVPGALNIAHTRLLARRDELPTDRELLVYCRSGSRAAAATAWLEREGYLATLVDDAFERWVSPPGGHGVPTPPAARPTGAETEAHP